MGLIRNNEFVKSVVLTVMALGLATGAGKPIIPAWRWASYNEPIHFPKKNFKMTWAGQHRTAIKRRRNIHN